LLVWHHQYAAELAACPDVNSAAAAAAEQKKYLETRSDGADVMPGDGLFLFWLNLTEAMRSDSA